MTTPKTAPRADLSNVKELLRQEADATRHIQQYAQTLKSWQEHREKLRTAIIAVMGDAPVGVVDGQELVTKGTKNQFATAQFTRDYPELARLYMVPRTKEVLDVEALVAAEPEKAAAYWTLTFTNGYQVEAA